MSEPVTREELAEYERLGAEYERLGEKIAERVIKLAKRKRAAEIGEKAAERELYAFKDFSIGRNISVSFYTWAGCRDYDKWNTVAVPGEWMDASDEEIEAQLRAIREAADAEKNEQEARQRAAQEENERKQYEALKAKFG